MPNPFDMNVPIIGQKKPDPFPLGGLAMAFPQGAPQIAQAFSSAIQAGTLQPDVTFAMLWTHASVEAQQLRLIAMALANELAELRKEPIPFELTPPLPRASELLALPKLEKENSND